MSDHREPRILPDLRAKLIEEGLLGDSGNFLADFANEGDGASRIPFGDEIGDCFEVAFDVAGEF